jgi:hypothetical protein
MKNRKSRRQEKRRHLLHEILREQKILNSQASSVYECSEAAVDLDVGRKTVLSIEEATKFFQYIDDNKLAKFSLQALHKIDLNVLYPVASIKKAYMGLKGNSAGTHISLLSHAVRMGNDKAAYGLIRAGSLFYLQDYLSFEKDETENDTPNSTTMLNYSMASNYPIVVADLFDEYIPFRTLTQPEPNTYLLWLLRIAHELKLNASHLDSLSCFCCERNASNWNAAAFLHFKPCGHLLCAVCFWKNVHKLDPLAQLENEVKFLLGHEIEYINLLYDMNSCCIICSSVLYLQCCQRLHTSSSSTVSKCLHLPAQQCKSASLKSFLELNEEHSSTTVVQNHLTVFRAAPVSESAAWLLGTIPSKRCEELLQAAESGNSRRLAALVQAGVDLEARYRSHTDQRLIICMRNV